MIRRTLEPRKEWQSKVEAAGMSYHTLDGDVYWDESACYRFAAAEIDTLENATAELYDLCCQAAEAVIRTNRFADLGIPEQYREYLTRSWENDEPSLYGRFDLCFGSAAAPKMLEFNADTPTALLEAAVVQWFWQQERFPAADQFNSIHEKLIASWQTWPDKPALIHFAAAAESAEDLGNVEYLRDTAIQADMATVQLLIEEIGWDADRQQFVDLDNQSIRTLFKLYP
jgi:glutathionylspermidine synthase